MITQNKLVLTFYFLFIMLFSNQILAGQNSTLLKNYNFMENASLENDCLITMPSKTSCVNDFDFLLGHHYVHHKKLETKFSENKVWIEFEGTHFMESLLNGTGNIERHFMNSGVAKTEGIALRLFNSTTNLWSIYWADSTNCKLDNPVVGSFENNIGLFYGIDNFNDKPLYVQFKWDLTNPSKPSWSQAFSADEGRTWEWNWHMYFSKNKSIELNIQNTGIPIEIAVIELRNYILKPGARDSFINYFEENFIEPQKALHGYPLGQYRVKAYDDHFFWIRGFENMQERSSFLPSFYYGPVWKQHKKVANSMLINNDNVHLLKPIALVNDSLVSVKSISSSLLIPKAGIVVIDFYTANTKLELLKKLFAKKYLPLLKEKGMNDYTLWVSESEPNDFPQLPVFQDKNLMVMITHFKNELDYYEATKTIDLNMSEDLKSDLQDAITIRNTLILYPTEKTNNQ